VAHIIIIGGDGVGPGGKAKGTIEYTPDHSVPPVVQIRKAERAEKMLERINDMLYGNDSSADHD